MAAFRSNAQRDIGKAEPAAPRRQRVGGLGEIGCRVAPAAPDVLESRQELRRLLNLMLIDRLKQLETQALAEAQSGEDPDALQRYKSLYERRRELIAQAG